MQLPRVSITGENYEVTGTKATVSAIVGHLRLMAFAILFAGDQIFGFLGGINQFPSAVKNVYAWIKENKF